jgi:hypothetical protein
MSDDRRAPLITSVTQDLAFWVADPSRYPDPSECTDMRRALRVSELSRQCRTRRAISRILGSSMCHVPGPVSLARWHNRNDLTRACRRISWPLHNAHPLE